MLRIPLPASLVEQAAAYASGELTPAEPRNAATVAISGLGAPALTAIAILERTKSTRLPATTSPRAMRSSSALAARMTTSPDS